MMINRNGVDNYLQVSETPSKGITIAVRDGSAHPRRPIEQTDCTSRTAPVKVRERRHNG